MVTFFTTTLVATILPPDSEKCTITGTPVLTVSIATGLPASSTYVVVSVYW